MDNQTKDLLMLTVDKVPEMEQDDREKLLWAMNRLTSVPSGKHAEAMEALNKIPAQHMSHVIGYMDGIAAGVTPHKKTAEPPMTMEEKGALLKTISELPEPWKQQALGFLQGLIAAQENNMMPKLEKSDKNG